MKLPTILIVCLLLIGNSLFAQSISDLESKTDRFVSDSREIYRFDEEASQLIWEAYCGELDPDVESTDQFARGVALSQQQREQSELDELLSTANDILKGLDNFKDNEEEKDKAADIRREVEREIGNLNKLKDGVVLRGSNHPFVQFAVEYGKKMHTELCSSEGESPKICDSNFPDVDGRPDLVFINSSGLWIFEFKPDNSKARSQGEDQLDRYQSGIERYFECCFPDGRLGEYKSCSGPASDDFLKKLQQCDSAWESDGKHVKVQTKVVTYHPCEKRF